MKALIKKELNRFINSPVFVTNAGFGLVLFVIGCIAMVLKFDTLIEMLTGEGINMTIEQINSYIPLITFAFVCFASFMSSITSSMISLEGKSFSILKSLPVKPRTIIMAKVLTAVLIMLPFILIGDLIIFINFQFNILEIIMILASSVLLPLVAEMIGIAVNLKYPKMDALNDTEVVKQSMSSTIAVFIGMILIGITCLAIFKMLDYAIPVDLIILSALGIYILIFILLFAYLSKQGTKKFNEINV